MPILDIQCCVKDNQIRFEFFKNPVSNPLLISKDSAMPFKTKRAALSSEALRRLRNTSRELPWAEKVEILSEFSHKLMCSGWDKKTSYDFIMAGLTRLSPSAWESWCWDLPPVSPPGVGLRTKKEEENSRKNFLVLPSWCSDVCTCNSGLWTA